MVAKSLLGLSILETNLDNNKSKVEELKNVIRKQNAALKSILEEHKNEQKPEVQDQIQGQLSLEKSEKENKRRKKGMRTDK